MSMGDISGVNIGRVVFFGLKSATEIPTGIIVSMCKHNKGCYKQ